MKLFKALIVLGICAFLVEFYRDWSGLSDSGSPVDRSTIALPEEVDNVTEDARSMDDETATVANSAAEDTHKAESSPIDKVQSGAEQEDIMRRIDMHYIKTVFRA